MSTPIIELRTPSFQPRTCRLCDGTQRVLELALGSVIDERTSSSHCTVMCLGCRDQLLQVLITQGGE